MLDCLNLMSSVKETAISLLYFKILFSVFDISCVKQSVKQKCPILSWPAMCMKVALCQQNELCVSVWRVLFCCHISLGLAMCSCIIDVVCVCRFRRRSDSPSLRVSQGRWQLQVPHLHSHIYIPCLYMCKQAPCLYMCKQGLLFFKVMV